MALRDFRVLDSEIPPLLHGCVDEQRPVDRHYGAIRSELERVGQPIGSNDLLIAAHAKALGVTLVTNNLGEFRRVPGLVVEDWQ